MKLFPPYSLIALCIFFAMSCTPSSDEETLDGQTNLKTTLTDLKGTSWTFTNDTASTVPSQLEDQITLNFTENDNDSLSFSGRTFANSYFGGFSLSSENGLVTQWDELATTLVANMNEEQQALEEYYYRNLRAAQYLEMVNGRLFVYLGDKSDIETVIMKFNRAN